jgi:tetratricopeptide (TPR) repeat protein
MFAQRSAACIVLIATAALATGCGGAQSRFAAHMHRGDDYAAHGEFAKASIEFRNAIQIEPANPVARVKAGEAAEKLGRIRDALGFYQSVIDTTPDNVQARIDLARLFVFGGAPARALGILEPALARHPDDAGLLTVRSAARARTNDLTGARRDAERAVQLAPHSEDAVATLAGLREQAGETQQAIALVRDTLSRVPDAVGLRHVLARLYASAGQPAQAEEQLRKLVELRPQELARRYQLALYLVSVKRLDEAQGVLEEAVKSAPQNDQAKLALVDFMTVQRSPAAGEKTLGDFIARQPDNTLLRNALGEILTRSGDVPGALATFTAVVKLDDNAPNGIIARERIAAIQIAKGNLPVADQLIGEVLKRNPSDNEALVLRGRLELERHEPAAAITDLRAVLRDQPNSTAVRRLLAAAFVANGEPALAEEQLRNALQATPSDIEARIDLARALGQTGNAAAAVACLEEGVRSAPSNPALREALVRAELASGKLDDARKALADLNTLVPDSATLPLLAGQIAQAAGQLAQSQQDYEQVLKLRPLAIEPLAALTKIDVARGASAEALTRIRATLAADPQNPMRVNLLAETLIAAKDYPEAAQTLTKLIQIAPSWGLAYHNLATARSLAGDPAGAIAAYEAGLKAVPFEPNLTFELAGLYERQGRAEDAIARCEALYKDSPQLTRAASNLALLLVDHRTDQHSLDRARDLTAPFANSADPLLLDAYGWVRYKRGEPGQALAPLERAAQAAPRSAPALYHLAMVQLKEGEQAKARANLEAALAAGSNFRGIADARVALASLAPTGVGG